MKGILTYKYRGESQSTNLPFDGSLTSSFFGGEHEKYRNKLKLPMTNLKNQVVVNTVSHYFSDIFSMGLNTSCGLFQKRCYII